MNEKLGFSGRIIQFFYAIGLPPMRILQGLIFVLVAGLIFAGLYIFDVNALFQSADKSDPNNDEASKVVVTQSSSTQFDASLDEEVDELYYFRLNENANYVVAIGQIEQQREKINELLKRPDLSADHKQKLQHSLLRHGKDSLRRNFNANIDSRSQLEDFTEFANSFVGGEDKKLEDFANFGIASSGILLLRSEPSKANAERLSETFLKTKSAFVESNERAKTLLSELLETRQLHPDKPHIDAVIDGFGKLLSGSKEESVAKLSTQIAEFSQFSTFDIRTLENRIRYRAKGSLQDLDNALRVLAVHPQTDISKWKMLIRAYEPSLSSGQPAVLQTGWKIVNDLVRKLPDTDEKKAPLITVLENQLQRSKKLGTDFDRTGDTFQGRPLDANENHAQLIVFCDRTKKSGQVLKYLRSQQDDGVQLRRPIVAFKDDYTREDRQKADQSPRGIQLASHDTSQKFIKQLSIDFYPYVALIDPQGKVAALDLTVDQAASLMLDLGTEANN